MFLCRFLDQRAEPRRIESQRCRTRGRQGHRVRPDLQLDQSWRRCGQQHGRGKEDQGAADTQHMATAGRQITLAGLAPMAARRDVKHPGEKDLRKGRKTGAALPRLAARNNLSARLVEFDHQMAEKISHGCGALPCGSTPLIASGVVSGRPSHAQPLERGARSIRAPSYQREARARARERSRRDDMGWNAIAI